NGIAQVVAQAGFDALLNDVSSDRIKSALATINGNLSRSVSKKALTEKDRDQTLARIKPAHTLAELSDCDVVIESVSEREAVTRKVVNGLCAVLKPDALIGSNTSSISITRLAASTDRPEKFIGIHFMNPVPRMELVELVRGIATEDSTFDVAREFVTTLGKR